MSKAELAEALEEAIKSNEETLRQVREAQKDYAKRAEASTKLANEAMESLRKAGILRAPKVPARMAPKSTLPPSLAEQLRAIDQIKVSSEQLDGLKSALKAIQSKSR